MLRKTDRRLSKDLEVDAMPFLLGYRLFNSDAPRDIASSNQYFRSKSCERRCSTGFISTISPSGGKGKG